MHTIKGSRRYYLMVFDPLNFVVRTSDLQTLVPRPARHEVVFRNPFLKRNGKIEGTEHRDIEVRDTEEYRKRKYGDGKGQTENIPLINNTNPG